MKTNVNAIIRLLFSVLLLLNGVFLTIQAQEGIDHEAFTKKYEQAFAIRKDARVLPMVDSLLTMARQSGNVQDEILAITIANSHWYYTRNNEEFERSTRRLLELSEKSGNSTFYYYGVQNKVAYLVDQHRAAEALRFLKQEQNHALSHHHIEGIYAVYRMLSVIYNSRWDLQQAIENSQKAIDYAKEFLPQMDYYENYANLANIYRRRGELEKMLKACNDGLDGSTNAQTRTYLMMYQCYALYGLKQYDAFHELYMQLKDNTEMNLGSSFFLVPTLRAMDAYYDGDRKKYEEQLGLLAEEEQCHLRIMQYECEHNLLMMQLEVAHLYSMRYRGREDELGNEMANMDAFIHQQILKMEKQRIDVAHQRLQLNHMHLSLHNSSLELERSRSAANLARMELQRNRLSLNNQQLRSRQLQDSLAVNKARQLSKHRKMVQRIKVFGWLFVFAFLLLLLAAAYLYRGLKMSRQLRRANRQLRSTLDSLRKARNSAREADALKTKFIEDINHEVRTPLNSIVGYSQVLAQMDKVTDMEFDAMAQRIGENSGLLNKLVNDVLDLTALESGKAELQIAPVAVNTLCRKAIASVRLQVAADVELAFETDVDEDFQIETDAQRTLQVLGNLLGNAAKNTFKGRIALACRLDNSTGLVSFVVTDTGVGVPAEERKRIFERFHKIDRFKQGTGLGLPICRVIAERLGGEVDIDPSYQGGARFWFSLRQKMAVLVMLLMSAGGLSVCAQHSSTSQMDKRLFPLYQKALANRTNQKGLDYADSLRRTAIAWGDHHGELAALTIPMLHEFYKKDNLPALEKAMVPLLEKSKEYGLVNYYEFALSNKVTYYVREQRYLEGLEYLKSQLEIARKENRKSGIYQAYRMQGVIYQFHCELVPAIRYFRQAMEFAAAHLPQRDHSNNYYNICDCYRMMGDYRQMLSTAIEAQQGMTKPERLYAAKVYEAYGHFMTGDDRKFKECYDYIATHKVSPYMGNDMVRKALDICKAIYDGHDAKAEEMLATLCRKSEEEGRWLSVVYYTRKHDFARSNALMREIFSLRNRRLKDIAKADSRSMNVLYKNNELENDKQLTAQRNNILKMNIARLALHNSDLEVERTKAAGRLASLEADQHLLSLRNQQLLSKQLSDSLQRQNYLRKSSEADMKTNYYLLLLGVIVTTSVALFTFIFVLINRRLTRRLRRSNERMERLIEEVDEARDHAQQADRMKTLFVQDMGENFRDPLNVVTGFSYIMVNNGKQLDMEEKKKAVSYLLENSEQLTALLKQLLDRTMKRTERNQK